jgi:hypothetical protein
MRIALAVLALAASPIALADATQPVQAVAASLATGVATPGFHARLYQRYCDKLREGPEAYAAFVKRMASVTGYTFTEFAPQQATDPVRHQCRDASGALASREQRGG